MTTDDDSVYVVCLRESDGELVPINLRSRSEVADTAPKYRRAMFAHPGWAFVVAERLTANHPGDEFVVVELSPANGTVITR